MSSIRELEWKFEPESEAAEIPDLAAFGMTLGPAASIDLRATYYDTADLRLLAHRLTLRHRTGGADAGWHLKLPADGDARTEVQIDGGPEGGIPAELLALTRSRARREPLAPRAILTTQRVERAISAADGTQLASMVDDRVHAFRIADGAVTEWRELEVELVGEATTDVLDDVSGALAPAGWRRSTSSSKVGRVLGTPSVPVPPARSAQGCLLDHLSAQVDAIADGDRLVRGGDAEAVHEMRVASRRLRSALATFRPFFDEVRTEPIRVALQALGAVLGAARDDDVLRARLDAALGDVPADLVLGRVGEAIALEMNDRHSRHGANVVGHLDSDDHLDLLDALDALVTATPWNSDHPIRRRALRRRVADAARRVDERAAFGIGMDDVRLHDWRKAAKRARYAAEVLVPLEGKPAERLAARFEALQEALGEHQDSVAARTVLRQLGAAARGRAQNGFTFGLLHEAQAQRGDTATASAWKAYRRTIRARDWLR